ELGVLEDEPRPEPPDVPIHEPRAVVELDDRSLVRDGHETEAPGHAEVDEECEAARHAQQQVLPASLDGDDDVALEFLRDLEQIVGTRQARVEDLDAGERATLEAWGELRPDRLDLRKLGHREIVGCGYAWSRDVAVRRGRRPEVSATR